MNSLSQCRYLGFFSQGILGCFELAGLWGSVGPLTHHLTNFCAPFFKEIPSFFCVVTPSKTLAAPQPLTIVFSLGNGGVLRSQEGEGFRKEGGGGDGKKKKEKRTRKKC